jgi:hypothetical protein
MSDDTGDKGLVDELREGAEHVEEGQFAVDPRKARQKLQKFRLAEPHRYVLQFVQAAHLLGASHVDIYVDADEVDVHFDGEPFRKQELESVHAAAFREEHGDRARALRHLAIGLTTAREVDPEQIVVESAPVGDEGVRLTIDQEAQPRLERGGGPVQGTTRIYLKEAYRDHHLFEFFKKFTGDLIEEKLVREKCRFSRLDIELNGDQVDRGLYLPDVAVGRVSFETEHEHGVLGFRDPTTTDWQEQEVVGHVELVQHSVLVCGHMFPGPLSALEPYAVIESDRLTKNLSQSGFVRDEAWHDLTSNVLPGVVARSVEKFVAELGADEQHEYREWLLQVAVDLWESGADLESGPEGELADRLIGLPIWPTACKPPDGVGSVRSGKRHFVSLAALGNNDEPLLYADGIDVPERPTEFEYPVLQVDAELSASPEPNSVRLPDELYADGVEVTRRLEEVETRRANFATWENRQPWQPPDEEAFPHRHRAEHGAYTCAAYVGGEAGESGLVYVMEGRRFSYRTMQVPLPECQLVVAGALPVDDLWEEVCIDGGVRDALFELVAALPGLVAASGASVAGFLEARLEGGLLHELFRNVGFEEPASAEGPFFEWLQAGEYDGWVCRFWRFDPGTLARGGPISTEELREMFGPLAEVPSVRLLSEERLSLVEMADHVGGAGTVRRIDTSEEPPGASATGAKARWVAESHSSESPSLEEWREMYRRAGPDSPVISSEGPELAIVETLFGEAVEPGEEWLRREAAKQRFFNAAAWVTDGKELAEAEYVREESYEFRVGFGLRHTSNEISMIGMLGERGYTSPSAGLKPRGEVQLEFDYEGYRLAERRIEVPTGRFRAVARGEGLEVNDDWTDVVENDVYAEVVERVEEVAMGLLQRRCREIFEERDVEAAELLAFWRAVNAAREDFRTTGLCRVPAFEVIGEGWMSHEELVERLESRDLLHYVGNERPVLESAVVDESVPIVRAPNNTDTNDLLLELFPVERIVDVTDNDFRRDALTRREQEFYQEARREPKVTPSDLPVGVREPLARVSLEGSELVGELAWVEEGKSRKGEIRQVVLHDGRVLVTERCAAPFGQWVAVCQAEWLEPTPDYRGLAGGAGRLEGRLREQAGGVIEQVAREVDAAEPGENRRERAAILEAIVGLRRLEKLPAGWSGALEALENCRVFVGPDGRDWTPGELGEAVEGADGRVCVVVQSLDGQLGARSEEEDVPVVTSRGFAMDVSEFEEALERLLGGVEFVAPADVSGRGGERGNPYDNLSRLERAVIARFVDICDGAHTVYGALPRHQLAFADTAGEVIRLDPDGVRLDRNHPAVEYLRAHAEENTEQEDSAIDVIPLALSVSSLYTALSREIGQTDGWDDREFYARHISAVAETFEGQE